MFITVGFLHSVQSQTNPFEYQAFSRQDYYSGEENAEIAVYIPEQKKDLVIRIDLVFEFQFLNRGYQVIPHGFSGVPFSLELLREGDNEITVSFYENDKWVDSRKVFLQIRKSVPNEVKIDRITGLMITAGLPLLPVGQEVRLPADISLLGDMARQGINLAAPGPDWGPKACTMNRKSFMNRCDAVGTRVNYNLSGWASHDGQAGFNENELKKLEKEIRLMKDHPALLAWTLAEDPVSLGILPDSLERAYRLLKSLDPYHPVGLRFKNPVDAIAYLGVTDFILVEDLTLPSGEESQQAMASFDLAGEPVWSVPGRETVFELAPGVLSERGLRHRLYSDLCMGASGFQRSGPARVWGVAFPMEMAEILPVMAAGHPVPPVTLSNPSLSCRMFNMNGLFVLLVVNNSEETMDFSLQMGEIDLTTDADVLFEGRKVRMKEGKITDVIFGKGVKIFVLDNRMKPDWVKHIHPGNLTLNPGFETMSSPGRPMHVIVTEDPANGASWFADGRVHRQGDRSLRLTTPKKGRGLKLSFETEGIEAGKKYTVSVWAGTSKWAGEQKFELSLGAGASSEFLLTDEWKEFSFTVPAEELKADERGRILPAVRLTTKGTAWFDVLQVYPHE